MFVFGLPPQKVCLMPQEDMRCTSLRDVMSKFLSFCYESGGTIKSFTVGTIHEAPGTTCSELCIMKWKSRKKEHKMTGDQTLVQRDISDVVLLETDMGATHHSVFCGSTAFGN